MPTFFAMSGSCRASSFRARSTAARLSATSASADAISGLRLPACEVLEARLGRAEGVAVPLDGERRFAEVEPDEQVARLHAVSLADLNLDDAPGDLRREIHDRGLDAAVQMDDRPVVLARHAASTTARPAAGSERSEESHREPPAAATDGPSSSNWMWCCASSVPQARA